MKQWTVPVWLASSVVVMIFSLIEKDKTVAVGGLVMLAIAVIMEGVCELSEHLERIEAELKKARMGK